jgi:ubiquinone/menaquinone biosynthesis C-methylase UbiE
MVYAPAMTIDSPFAGTAAFYSRFRSPYPDAALAFVRASFQLDARSRVLDLGCGPGTVAIPLSHAVGEVLAVDPDADMLAEGERLAAQRRRRNIRWECLRAEEIGADLGCFRLVTMGQSFHWMDRDRVLSLLAERVEDGGGLALINPGRRRKRHALANPEPAHEPALRRSAFFHQFSSREFRSEMVRDVPSIIGHCYSTSGVAKRLFGDAAARFEADLRAELIRRQPSGVFREQIETEVMIVPKLARNSVGPPAATPGRPG